MNIFTILIIGGYGNFGKRICESLVQFSSVHLIIAGRDQDRAQALAYELNQLRVGAASILVLDSMEPDLIEKLYACEAQLLINASGPYKGQDYAVARACIKVGIHYLDLADSSEFVAGIGQLDELAKAASVAIVSGASTVPALSSTVVDKYIDEFDSLKSYYAGITPGYQAERGAATTEGILSYLGHSIQIYDNNEWEKVTALQGLHCYDYHNELGKRLLGYVDVPDLKLFPKRYADIQTAKFYSGLEIKFMHYILYSMTWLTRLGIVKNWVKYVKPIIKLSHYFDKQGTPDGGMFIELTGHTKDGRHKKVVWHLIACHGYGPYVPTIPIVVLIKKLMMGEQLPIGAYPCMGLFKLEEFFEIASQWGIEQTIKIQ